MIKSSTVGAWKTIFRVLTDHYSMLAWPHSGVVYVCVCMVTTLKGHLFADEFQDTFKSETLSWNVFSHSHCRLWHQSWAYVMKAQASEWAFYMGHSGKWCFPGWRGYSFIHIHFHVLQWFCSLNKNYLFVIYISVNQVLIWTRRKAEN